MEEIDTALCLQQLSLADRDVALPANIHPGIFTTLSWDNIDHLEEITSGGGTSHSRTMMMELLIESMGSLSKQSPLTQHNCSVHMFGKGTYTSGEHSPVENIPEQFIQQDEPRQVLGWRVERADIQRYAARQGIVCKLRRNLLQDDSR